MIDMEALRAAIAKMGREDAKLTLKALQKAEANVATNDIPQERVDKTSEIVHEPMHPQLKAMLEEYFDKCFAESAQQRTWVGLTDDEILKIYSKPCGSNYIDYAKAIEAKLKEKNT